LSKLASATLRVVTMQVTSVNAEQSFSKTGPTPSGMICLMLLAVTVMLTQQIRRP